MLDHVADDSSLRTEKPSGGGWPKKRLIKWGVRIGCCSLLLGLWYHRYGLTARVANDFQVNEGVALRYLAGAVADRKDSKRRDKIGHIEMFIPDRVELWAFPARYAHEKLVYAGHEVVPVMERIVLDRNQSSAIRVAAGRVLAVYDDPQILSDLRSAAGSGLLSGRNLSELFGLHMLPHWPRGSDMDLARMTDVMPWVDRALREGRQKFLLSQLDHTMTADSDHDGLAEGGWDSRPLILLDRLYDFDLSEWLRQKAPSALEFRERQFKKGYDPVFAFDDTVYEGMKRNSLELFSDKRDQDGCRQLLEVVHDILSPLHPDHREGWTIRLKQWYFANRDTFVYDYALHRFVSRPDPSKKAKMEAQPAP